MLTEIQQLFPSLTKSLDIFYVLHDLKKVSRILCEENQLDKVTTQCKNWTLTVEISDFKVIKHAHQGSNYSDYSEKVDKEGEQKGDFFLYISKDAELAAKAKQAEHEQDHKLLGKLLGYPECCCDFFKESFNNQQADLTLQVAQQSKECRFPWEMNICTRHKDATLLSHFPCSFSCQESLNQAQDRFKLLSQHHEAAATHLQDQMTSAVIYTSNRGIFFLQPFSYIHPRLTFKDITATQENALSDLLKKHQVVSIQSANTFQIEKEYFDSKNIAVLIFEDASKTE